MCGENERTVSVVDTRGSQESGEETLIVCGENERTVSVVDTRVVLQLCVWVGWGRELVVRGSRRVEIRA